MEIIKVVAYCRVSTNKKDQENSFENQHTFFLNRANETEEEELINIYADKGITGTSVKKRDEFKRMLYDAGINEYRGRDEFTYEVDKSRRPKFNKIYVRNTSRLTRDSSIITILRALLKNKVYVHFLDIDLIYDDPSKEFMLNMFINFAQQESIDKSKKVRDGNIVMAERGSIRIGGRGIYGYEYSRYTKSLSIIEKEAEVVRKIFSLYLEGYGIRRLINYLAENNYKPRGGKEAFTISSIKQILSNEKYYGCNVRNKYDTGVIFNKKYPQLKPQSEWIYHEGVIPAIIDKETFEKVQNYKKSKIHHETQVGVYKGISEYAGYIKCGKCGASYTRNKDKGRIFYNCGTKKSKGAHVCDNLNISVDTINEGIAKLLSNGIKKKFDQYKELMVALLNDVVRSKITTQIDKQNEDIVAKLEEAVEKLVTQKNKLAELYLEGDIEKSFLDSKSIEINVKLEQLNKQIEELSKSNEQIYNELAEFDSVIEEIKKTNIEEVSSRKDLLKLIIMNIEPHQNNNKIPMIKFYFKFDQQIKHIATRYKFVEEINTMEVYW